VLVNNAGILRAGAYEDIDQGTLREVMETNFTDRFCWRRPYCRRCGGSGAATSL
jgi:NAD(P)-dependent dehydrogenase (short-subunit alcohol dehydrogenase family)